MAPLGIITAIVGAIRVGGPPWLKAVIGRARENRSSAELEFMSSTSHEVCELWNGEGIVRTTGKGIVKQIVYLEGCGDPEKECFLFTLTKATTGENKHTMKDEEKEHTTKDEEKRHMTKEGECNHCRLIVLVSLIVSCITCQRLLAVLLIVEHTSFFCLLMGLQLTLRLLFEVYQGPLIKRLFRGKKDPYAHEDPTDRAPNISLNLHRKQATWELFAAAAAGIALQSGVLVFSGFVAYNPRFGNRVGGPPSAYAFPILVAGTVTLVLGMWISALVIGKSTEEFKWEVIPKPHPGDIDSTEKPLPASKREELPCPPFRVFWLQKGIFVSDQSFDSFMLMAKGQKEIILTSCRDNDPVYDKDGENIAQTEGSTDPSVSLNIWCIIGTFASITGFVLQFEGFRGISWACSIAQLVAIMIMTIVRAIIRRGMLDKPATEKITPDYEMDWLALKVGFIDGYLTSLSDSPVLPRKPCLKCGIGKSKSIPKVTSSPPCNHPSAPEASVWEICNELSYPIRTEWIDKLEKPPAAKRGVDLEKGAKSGAKSKVRPGYPVSSTLPISIPEKSFTLEMQEKIYSLQVQAVVNIRKRLGVLTEWTAPSPYAACVAKAITHVMSLFEWGEKLGEKATFVWYMDVQIARDESKRGKLRLEASKGSLTDKSSWSAPEKDIEALLSLWMYHFKRQHQRGGDSGDMRSVSEKSGLIRAPFRRVLGPNTEVLKTDLAWWAGEGVAESLETFTWDKSDKSLSLGYSVQGKCSISSYTRRRRYTGTNSKLV